MSTYREVAGVTARVTTLKGADAGAYYVEALPNYYLDSGEPKVPSRTWPTSPTWVGLRPAPRSLKASS